MQNQEYTKLKGQLDLVSKLLEGKTTKAALTEVKTQLETKLKKTKKDNPRRLEKEMVEMLQKLEAASFGLSKKISKTENQRTREQLGYTKEYMRSAALTLQWVLGEKNSLIGDKELAEYIKMARG